MNRDFRGFTLWGDMRGSVQFSHAVVSNSATLWTAAHQCLSCTISQSLLKFMSIESVMPSNHLILCHPHFSSCPQPFPPSGSFPMRWLFPSGGQSTGASASASALSINIQDLFPLGWTGLISLLSKGLSSSKASILRHSAFFVVQLSHPYMTTEKTIDLTRWTFEGKGMSLLF